MFLKNRIAFLIILLLSICKYSHLYSQSIIVDTILLNTGSIRAILPTQNKIWYGASDGKYGYFDFSDNTTFQKRIIFDSIKPDFRSIAQTQESIFILNAGSPALLYKISKSDLKIKLVYHESDKKAFYDSMSFWNTNDGIAIGDPTGECLSILLTHDGGNTWSKVECSNLPKTVDGEAAFAASNSIISISGDNVWIASGGKKSRIFYSADKGKSWHVYETPIVQGEAMTGIFSADFYSDQIGIIAGGNYELPKLNEGNKAITSDGGKTWKLIAEKSGFGYASCIRFVPESNAQKMISVGASGLCLSTDYGNKWQQLLADATLYTIRFLDRNTAFAAGKDKIIRIRFR